MDKFARYKKLTPYRRIEMVALCRSRSAERGQ